MQYSVFIKQQRFQLSLVATLLSSTVLSSMAPVLALPPPQDQPEEVLRTEIILEARSPIDGEPMTAAEYAELQAQLEAEARQVGVVPPRFREIVTLLRIRKVLRTILPFLP